MIKGIIIDQAHPIRSLNERAVKGVHTLPTAAITLGVASADREFGQPLLSRDELLDAPLLQLHGCSLSMRCYEGCTKPGSLSLQQMAATYGKGLQLRRALARLRCKGCRRPPAAVTICDHPTPDALPTWRVVLVP